MPTTYAIPDGRTVMAATTYTGTGASLTVSNAVNGVSFQPDFVWIKRRDGGQSHQLYDVIRGVNQALYSNLTNAETTETNGLSAFTTSGFTVISDIGVNTSGGTYVGWNWKASGSTVSNTSGSITSTVSAGATQGFSVVTYTGTGANATVGHGLGVAPSMVIVKKRSGTDSWAVYNSNLTSAAYALILNSTSAQQSIPTYWNSTAPTSSVFTVSTDSAVNASASTYVAYCFSAVAGYSAFGSYTGNGSTDGPFVFTNFQPRFIMVKRTDSTSNWYTYDSSRNTANPESLALYPNASYTEDTEIYVDFLSNGFKCRSATVANISGATYIYMAFASNPLKYSNAR
jgi:hypothetical protein